MLNEFYNFIKEIAPVRTQIEWGAAVSVIGTAFCYLVGGWNDLIEALVFAMCFDYVSGILAAYINPNIMLDSRIGCKGIGKKVMILLLVATAHFTDQATNQQIIKNAVIWFFLGNEGLSIIENAAKAGIPIPNKLKTSLEQLSTEKMGVKKL